MGIDLIDRTLSVRKACIFLKGRQDDNMLLLYYKESKEQSKAIIILNIL
ncbi:MAG TPA: hypothetical protein VJL78_03285 [Candidatus Nitrosocosmicus sp.]|nr:hypothetical protein [Candidatus Nitrosocosmicus sp.]